MQGLPGKWINFRTNKYFSTLHNWRVESSCPRNSLLLATYFPCSHFSQTSSTAVHPTFHTPFLSTFNSSHYKIIGCWIIWGRYIETVGRRNSHLWRASAMFRIKRTVVTGTHWDLFDVTVVGELKLKLRGWMLFTGDDSKCSWMVVFCFFLFDCLRGWEIHREKNLGSSWDFNPRPKYFLPLSHFGPLAEPGVEDKLHKQHCLYRGLCRIPTDCYCH